MNPFGPIGRLAGRIAGVDAIKAGGGVLASLGRGTFGKKCPLCRQGLLTEARSEAGGEMVICSQCDYFQPKSGPRAEEFALLRERLEKELNAMTPAERLQIEKRFLLQFRVYAVAVVVAIVVLAYAVFVSHSTMVFLLAGCNGLLLITFAMKSSYRFWQFRTRTFFQPGSFRRWLKEGQWIV